jgi:hypothetical protein
MWPPEVERIAAPLRAAGIEARLEELPPGEAAFPSTAVRTVAYACNGSLLVVLVPAGRDPDLERVAAAGNCRGLVRVEPPPFPFAAAARVFLEQRLVPVDTLWLEAGSPRHVLGLEPSVLVQVTRAVPADLTQDG